MIKNSFVRRTMTFAIALVVLFTASGHAQQATPTTAAEPNPMSVIRVMCDYLNTLRQFSYHAEGNYDVVYYGGKKLQYGLEMDTYVKRPDKLRVNAQGDLVNKQFFLNGNTMTLYDLKANAYATMDVPPDIESALEKASKDFGLRVSLTELASPMLFDLVSKRVVHSLYVGLHKVRGVPCHHIALDNPNVHLQVWIDSGEKSLPLKVVIEQKKMDGHPQWTAYLSWNTSSPVDDSLFSFSAPSDAQKIKFVPAKQTPAPKKKKGGKS
jgi:hypothetical protein